MANRAQVKLKFYDGYGENFKALREKEGLTLSELGEQLFYSDKTISMIENESRLPTIEQLNRYIEKFNVSLDYLTGRTKAMTSDLQMICEYTGLSEAAVRKLHEFATAEYGHSFIERPCPSVELEGIEIDKAYNANAMSFINSLITDVDFQELLNNAVKLKEDMDEIKAAVPDDNDEAQAQNILTRKNRAILRKAKRFVVRDKGYCDLMIEKMKTIFGNIADRIIKTE